MKRILSVMIMILVLMLSLSTVSAQVVTPFSGVNFHRSQFDPCRFTALSALGPHCNPSGNDAPVIVSTPVTSGTVGNTYIYDVDATDADGDILTYSLQVKPTGMAINSATGVISWVPLSSQLGANQVTVVVDDGTDSVSQAFTINVVTGGSNGGSGLPNSAVCEVQVGDLDIEDFDFDDDDYKPGDEVEVEYTVENNGDDDIDDVKVKVSFVDLDEGKVLESETDTFDLDEGDDEEGTITLKIPTGLDDDHDYEIAIKVFEKGNEDLHCASDHESIDIEIEDEDAAIDDIELTSSTLSCGETTSLLVEVENIGIDDLEDDLSLEIRNRELNIFERSEFDLDDGDDIDRSFTLFVPKDAKDGIYLIEAKVIFDGDTLDTETVTLTVSGCKASEEEDSDDVVITFGGSEGRTDFTGDTNVKPTSKKDSLNLALWVVADLALLVIIVSLIILAIKGMRRGRQRPEPAF